MTYSNWERISEMQYFKEKRDDSSILYRFHGELTAYTMDELEQDIIDEIKRNECSYFEFDFSRVQYIDSRGIRILVLAGKYNHDRGKKLNINKVQPRVERVLKLAELNFLLYELISKENNLETNQ